MFNLNTNKTYRYSNWTILIIFHFPNLWQSKCALHRWKLNDYYYWTLKNTFHFNFIVEFVTDSNENFMEKTFNYARCSSVFTCYWLPITNHTPTHETKHTNMFFIWFYSQKLINWNEFNNFYVRRTSLIQFDASILFYSIWFFLERFKEIVYSNV